VLQVVNQEEAKKVKCMLREWEDEIKRSEDPAKEAEHLRAVVAALILIEGTIITMY
jgi:hypothetical protein